MRFFWYAVSTALRSQLCAWKTWIFILLLPGTVWVLTAILPAEERAAPVQVGVCLPPQGGQDFWALLEARSGTVVSFVAADEDTVVEKVASGQWDCGLLLPEDFSDRLKALDGKGLITLCVGEGSTVYPVVRETAAACLAQLMSPGIAREYLLDSGIASPDTVSDMEPRLEEFLPESERVRIVAATLDGRELDTLSLADGALGDLFHGMIAVVLLIWAMFSAVDMGRWLAEPSTRRLLALRSAAQVLLPRAMASAVPVLCAGAGALYLLPGGGGLGPLAAYVSALSTLALLAARAEPVWRSLPVLAPAAPVVCLLTAPILFDPAALLPVLAPVSRWLPTTLYLRACRGGWIDGAALWGWTLGTVLLALPEQRHPSSKKTARDGP